MKIAVVGSRNVVVKNIEQYVSECDEIVSGGAVGVDSCAADYAKKIGKDCEIILSIIPEYQFICQ